MQPGTRVRIQENIIYIYPLFRHVGAVGIVRGPDSIPPAVREMTAIEAERRAELGLPPLIQVELDGQMWALPVNCLEVTG